MQKYKKWKIFKNGGDCQITSTAYLSNSSRLASSLRKMNRNMVNAQSEEPP
jgi:hypothetical protein